MILDNSPRQRPDFPPLLVLVGPTAIGKTRLSLKLAELFQGEIVSADSRLLYKGLDIGTDKPSPGDRAAVPHHLIDVCWPDETVTLGQYQRMAYERIDEIAARNRLPILVGGTGQYVKAVVEGWGIPAVAPHDKMRQSLESLGKQEAYRWLGVLDPAAAGRIDPRNMRRVIRALEVTMLKGRPISVLQKQRPPDYQIDIIGLTCKREILYERIDERVERMLEDGLIDEVRRLLAAGYSGHLPAMSGLGYRQILAYLKGDSSLDETVERIKFETHRFVRQQYTWFGLSDPAITWFDTESHGWERRVVHHVKVWLQQIITREP